MVTTSDQKIERLENAIAIARDHGGKFSDLCPFLVRTTALSCWTPGDIVEQGEWVGFLVVSISDSGEAVLLR